MSTILFASNNVHKAREIRDALNGRYTIQTLKEADIDLDIPEPFDTLEENAMHKSMTIFSLTGENCFSEDSGLEVDALGGKPGAKSARFAGENLPASAHIDKLLEDLDGQKDRRARFRTVISLILDGKEFRFSGVCEGRILNARQGTGGFGYDPIFAPGNSEKSFAEMSAEAKNAISHRGKALRQLISFLSEREENLI